MTFFPSALAKAACPRAEGFRPGDFFGRVFLLCVFLTMLPAGAPGAAVPPECADIQSGMAAWWQGEGTGVDSVGAATGTVVGNTSFSVGSVGQAFQLDGNTGGLECGNPSVLKLQNFTIECWIKRTSTAIVSAVSDQALLAGHGDGGYALGLFSDGGLFLTHVGSSAVRTAAGITDTQWHHIAVTKADGVVVFYIDGAAHPMPSYAPVFTFTSGFALGRRPGGGNGFYGAIDEAAVYNRALSTAEIQTIYQAGSAGKCLLQPSITKQPSSRTNLIHQTALFSVEISGDGRGLTYQWYFEQSKLPGETSSTLRLVDVQFASQGNYWVAVSNGAGGTVSAMATLTVLEPPLCTEIFPGAVGLWQGENETIDSLFGNHGVLHGNAAIDGGRVGQGFVFDGSGDGVILGNPAGLQVQNLTIEGWVRRGSATVASAGDSLGLLASYGYGGYGFGIWNDGRLFLSRIGLDNVTGTAVVTDTNWHHVAVTRSNQVVIFYVDGIAYPASEYNAQFFFTSPLAIGMRGDNGAGGFLGGIDELGIYNRALSELEIGMIHVTGSTGRCDIAPAIVVQPQNLTRVAGQSAGFSVIGQGRGLRYQWWFQGVPLPGETNVALSLLAVQPTQAGSYYVTVVNEIGMAVSSSARLTVVSPSNCIAVAPGAVGWWQAEGTAWDTLAGNHGTMVSGGFGDGWAGRGFEFDGVDDGVILDNTPALQLQNFSMECWIRRNSTNRSSLSADCAVLVGYGYLGYALLLYDGGDLALNHIGITESRLAGAGLHDTNWHHVAVTKNDSIVTFVIDGVAHSAPNLGTFLSFGSRPAIGMRADNGGNNFYGGIDEVAIYNRPLSTDELRTSYLAGYLGKCSLAPVIHQQPQSALRVRGQDAVFAVVASGSPPLSLQWRLNGQPIPGQTNPVLILPGVTVGDAGGYSLVLSNAHGFVVSASALLTVIAGEDCVAIRPVGWWRGDGDFLDDSGTNHGVGFGDVSFAGSASQNLVFDGNGDGVALGHSSSLHLQNFTIEGWIKRTSTNSASAGGSGGVVFGFGSGGYGFGMGNDGRLFLSALDASSVSAAARVFDTGWHHVAVTKSNAAVIFYVDGISYPAPAYDAVFSFGSGAAIGARAEGSGSFFGGIDELAVFDRVLSGAQVDALYRAGRPGKCPLEPVILEQPAGLTNAIGLNAKFRVGAGGTQPLHYQWLFNGTPLAGQTNSILSLANLQASNQGVYAVVVSNELGSVTSSNAPLGLFQPVCAPVPFTAVAWWPAEDNALDVIAGNHGSISGNAGFSAGWNGAAFTFDGFGDGVVLGNPPALRLQNFTIESWVQRSHATRATQQPGSSTACLLAYGREGYGMGMFDDGRLFLSKIGIDSVVGTAAVTDTEWHHVAVAKEGASVVFYIDGSVAGVANYDSVFTFSSSVTIGASGSDSGSSFWGKMDEPAVYGRALAATEVKRVYDARQLGKCPPQLAIEQQPQSRTNFIGDTVSFSVILFMGRDAIFQWRFEGADLPGETNATLVLSSIQANQAGAYSVMASNALGVVVSSNAILTVIGPGCVPVSPDMVAWWEAENNARDAIGSAHGAVAANTGFEGSGIGMSFRFDGDRDGVLIQNHAALQLQEFSIEGWVKRSHAQRSTAQSDSATGCFIGYGQDGYAFGMYDDGRLFLSKVNVNAINSAGAITDTNWHHVALIRTAANVTFYIDGQPAGSAPYASTFVFSSLLALGASGANLESSFLGAVDELTVHRRPLSFFEVRTVHAAGALGRCLSEPVIVAQPQSRTNAIGETALFRVEVRQARGIQYQWRFNGNDLSGETNAALVLPAIRTDQAGVYSVVLSNTAGMLVSDDAFLTVISNRVCTEPAASIVGWWQGEPGAFDVAGTNHGTVLGTAGVVDEGLAGRAFSFDGIGAAVSLGQAPGLQLQNLTIECWIKRARLDRTTLDGGSSAASLFGFGLNGYGFGIGNDGVLFFSKIGTDSVISSGSILDTEWHHIAVTRSGSNVVFYIDGAAAGAVAYPGQFSFTTSAAIGAIGDTLKSGFCGFIDEVAVYNGALTPGAMESLFFSRSAAKCPMAPRVVVQPVSATNLIGESVSFSVVSSGFQPITYQWRFNGTNLLGETSATLTIVNVQSAHAGSYSVELANAAGTTSSSNAVLTVLPSPPCALAGSLVAWWAGDGSTREVLSSIEGIPLGNASFGPGKVNGAFVFDGGGDGISLNPSGSLQLQDLTIECWVKRTRTDLATLDNTSTAILFGYGEGGYGFGMHHDGRLFLSRIGFDAIFSTGAILDTNWHHVAVTRSTGVGRFYIDGQPAGTAGYGSLFTFVGGLAIGALPNGAASFLGAIDEPAVYAGALSEAEVFAIFRSGYVGKCVPPPVILAQPESRTNVIGDTVAFSVIGGGGPGIRYRWRFNGSDLSGQTNPVLEILDVQLSHAGQYSVQLSNAGGTVLSDIAVLTVLTEPVCIGAAAGLRGWWTANGDLWDSGGTNHGAGPVVFTTGKSGQAFLFDGDGDAVRLGAASSLRLQSFTIEGWVRRSSSSVVTFTGPGALFLSFGQDGYGFGLLDDGRLSLSKIGGAMIASTNAITDTEWHHVAVTRDGPFRFYIDGQPAGSASSLLTGFSFTTPAAIGARGDTLQNSFYGGIDELAIYSGAMSESQIAAIFHARHAGKCPQPPKFVRPPQDQAVPKTQPALFTVGVAGSPPISYQWRFNGTDLPGATNVELAIERVMETHGGYYSVVCSNMAGQTVSTQALLTVLPEPTCTQIADSVLSWWSADQGASDHRNAHHGTVSGNTAFVSGKVGQAFGFDGDRDFVGLGPAPGLKVQQFTIEAWVKRSNTNRSTLDGMSTTAVLFGYSEGGYGFGMSDNGRLFLSRIGFDSVQSTQGIGDTQWHHVAVVRYSDSVQFYIDGVSAGAALYGTAFVFTTDAAIGGLANGRSSFWGAIDELAIYNSTLSATQVQAIVNSGGLGKCDACETLPAGAVAWWEASGNALVSVGINNGTLLGTAGFGPGFRGEAFLLNGERDGVALANSPELQLQDFTIEAWIRRSTLSGPIGGRMVFGYGANGYGFGVFNDGRLFLSRIGFEAVTSSVAAADTNWHHIAVTKSGSQVVFYVDGMSSTANLNVLFTFATAPAIGIRSDVPNDGFAGSIDELTVYRRALSPAEIGTIHGAGRAGKCPPPLEILGQPASLTNDIGDTASFYVIVSGVPPITYQWRFNGSNLPGSTNGTLTIRNVAPEHAGAYSVAISNAAGWVISADAQLTVLNPTSCAAVPAGAVGWWSGNGAAKDNLGTNDGTLVGHARFDDGKVGVGFLLDGNQDAIRLGNDPSLHLQDFSIETWIQRSSSSQATLGSFQIGMFFCYPPQGYGFGMRDNGELILFKVGPDILNSGIRITDTNWHHVAVTKSGTNVTFYLDSVAANAPPFTAVFAFTGAPAIGARSDTLALSFYGRIDDLAIYNRALSPSEVGLIYNASALGKCPPGPVIVRHPESRSIAPGNSTLFSVGVRGGLPFQYQWRRDGIDLPGMTNAALPVSNVQTADEAGYSVRIVNAAGSATSADGVLDVLTSVNCVAVPADAVGWWRAEDNALDSVGVNHGTLYGNVSYAAGRVGSALVLDGETDLVTVGNPTNLHLQNFTIEGWIKRGSTSIASIGYPNGALFCFGSGGYGLAISNNGSLFLTRVAVDSAASDLRVVDLNWHHVAITKSGNSVVFYVDGIPGMPLTYNSTFTFAQGAAIGARPDGSHNSFYGMIDEMSVYARPLSAAEIYAIYNSGSAGKCLPGASAGVTRLQWKPIRSPQFVDVPFNVTIQAKDEEGRDVTNFFGPIEISGVSGEGAVAGLQPGTPVDLEQGTWAGSITVSQASTNLSLRADNGSGVEGIANAIQVLKLPNIDVQRSAEALTLSWPATAAGFSIETAPELHATAWQPVLFPVQQQGDRFVVDIPLSETNRFFRLRFVEE